VTPAPHAVDLTPIGAVESPLGDPESAPRQGDEGAPEARIVVAPAYREALDGLRAGDEVIVVTWLHRARRDVLRVHPRGDVVAARAGRLRHPVAAPPQPDRPPPGRDHRHRRDHADGPEPRGRGRHAGPRPQGGAA